MAQLLPKARYDDIRRAVDPMLDDEAIPDELIESSLNLVRAEAWVRLHVPLAESLTGDDLETLYQAIVLHTASLISPTVPQFRQVNMAGHNVTLAYGETVAERTQRLYDASWGLVTLLVPSLTTIQVVDAPIFVTTVSGRRG